MLRNDTRNSLRFLVWFFATSRSEKGNIMMNRLRQFMIGRYGVDELGIFMLIVYVVLSVINIFVSTPVIVLICYAIFFLWVFRAFSRNIYKRQQENQKFLVISKPFRAMINLWKRKFKEKETSRFFKCPGCKQTIRVPKGKGKIAIRCPKCGNEFVRRT